MLFTICFFKYSRTNCRRATSLGTLLSMRESITLCARADHIQNNPQLTNRIDSATRSSTAVDSPSYSVSNSMFAPTRKHRNGPSDGEKEKPPAPPRTSSLEYSIRCRRKLCRRFFKNSYCDDHSAAMIYFTTNGGGDEQNSHAGFDRDKKTCYQNFPCFSLRSKATYPSTPAI